MENNLNSLYLEGWPSRRRLAGVAALQVRIHIGALSAFSLLIFYQIFTKLSGQIAHF